MMRLTPLLGVAALALFCGAPVLAQNRPDPRLEGRLLRQASSQEAGGDLAGAEATLRDLLERQPSSSSAVFALERVLRARGSLQGLLPLVDVHLAADPGSGPVRFLKVRVLAEVDSIAGLGDAVDQWIRAEPASPDPYREGARIYREKVGLEEAIALVDRGLDDHSDSPVLLIELGDLLVAAERLEEAAVAWARALGQDRAQTQAVFRRIDELDDGVRVTGLIVQDLGSEPTSVARLEVGSELALRAGMDGEAQRLAQAATERLQDREAKGFLNGFARKAEDLGRTASALWAYESLRARVDDPVEGRSTDERLAEAALQSGDSVAAFDALQRIRMSHAPATEERAAAWARELSVQVSTHEPGQVLAALQAFREEYPDAPELADLSAGVAARLLSQGERETAMEVLEGIEGPGASLERAYLLLENGALGEGIQSLRESVPQLEPAHATEVIQLSLMLSRLSPPAAMVAAQAAVLDHRGDPDASIDLIGEAVERISLEDRPALLAFGARAADRARRPADAEALRRRILTDHGEAPEMPDAALRLARTLALSPESANEAVQILEALILAHPSSPVVPDARRELRRIQGAGS
ncbi:MAG: tetratricopeptide repeat protein [Gemmatimonadetes bacterium]|nr:tetratricopeptide repeat protein [Gemmatimonadota bacterium]